MCIYVSVSLYDNNFGDYNVGVHYHIYMCGARAYVPNFSLIPRPLPMRGEGRGKETRLSMFAPG